MARIRTIKPEFFTSEDIVSLSPFARLLYIALWCEADREGRLVWKPKTFKLRYFPGDDCTIDSACDEIVDRGLVKLYGDGLAFIPSFGDHQHINPRETASTLAPPDASSTRRSRVRHASARDEDAQGGREGKGREGNKDQQLLSTTPSNDPNPASEPKPSVTPPADIALRRAERLAAITDNAIEVYNRTLAKPHGKLAAVNLKVGRKKRQEQVRRSLETASEICADQYGDKRITPEFWENYFGACADDPFTSGDGPYAGQHANWRPDFEYLTRPATVLRVFERATNQAETG